MSLLSLCFYNVFKSNQKIKMWLLLKGNIRRQFKATLQGGARKGKVSERPKNVDFQYNSRRTSKKKLKAIMEKI